MACTPISQCCDGTEPLDTYFATFTNVGVGGGIGCDCIETVVVELTLFETGPFAPTGGPCDGCETAESWLVWRGFTDVPGCFAGVGTVRFCVQLSCNPAGISTGCGNFAVHAAITCGDPDAPACPTLTPITMKVPPDCTCDPFYLQSDGTFSALEDPGDCCRNSDGDVISGLWSLEVTE